MYVYTVQGVYTYICIVSVLYNVWSFTVQCVVLYCTVCGPVLCSVWSCTVQCMVPCCTVCGPVLYSVWSCTVHTILGPVLYNVCSVHDTREPS